MAFSNRALIIAAIVLIMAGSGEPLQPDPLRIEGGSTKLNKLLQVETEKGTIQDRYNEVEEERIQISEPYKVLIQTTARFALVQTKASNYLSTETAMSLINDIGFMLSKPSTLIKAVKLAAVTVASILATIFLFPGGYRTIDAFWHNPSATIEKFLPNGISERSVLGLFDSKVDDILTHIGLNDVSCRERTICQVGELFKDTYPDIAERATKFASDHFLTTNFRDNRYVTAFSSGFVDGNCGAFKSNGNSGQGLNCISDLLNYSLASASTYRTKNKYQRLDVWRA